MTDTPTPDTAAPLDVRVWQAISGGLMAAWPEPPWRVDTATGDVLTTLSEVASVADAIRDAVMREVAPVAAEVEASRAELNRIAGLRDDAHEASPHGAVARAGDLQQRIDAVTRERDDALHAGHKVTRERDEAMWLHAEAMWLHAGQHDDVADALGLSRDTSMDVLLRTVGNLRAAEVKFEERLGDIQAEYRKAADSWDRQRGRLTDDLDKARAKLAALRAKLDGAVVLPEDWTGQTLQCLRTLCRANQPFSPDDMATQLRDGLVALVESWRPAVEPTKAPDNLPTPTGAPLCVLTEDSDMEAFAALPECQKCGGLGKDVPADFWGAEPETTDTVESDEAEPTAGVDYKPGCADPACPCAKPGRPCEAWEGPDDAEWCPRCGWSRRRHHLTAPPGDCRSEEGITVGLIDGIIATVRVLAGRDLTHPTVREAVADLRDDKDVRRLVAPGETEADRG